MRGGCSGPCRLQRECSLTGRRHPGAGTPSRVGASTAAALTALLVFLLPGAVRSESAGPVHSGDPGAEGAASDALSLDGAIREALSHNPLARAASAQRDLAIAKLLPDRPVIRPAVTVTASQLVEGPTLDLPLPTGRRTVLPWQEHQLEVQAEQVLYHAGKSANAVRLRAQTSEADATYDDAIDGVAHDAAAAYYQLLQARSGASVAHQAIDAVQQNVTTVHLLIQAGQAVPLDLLTAQQALSGVRQDAAAADSGVVVAEANLNRTLGRPLRSPVSLEPPSSAQNLPPAPSSLDDAIRIGLASRPDIRQREAEVASARAGVSLAHSEGGPTVSANASYAVQTPTALRNNQQWTLSAIVSLPLLQTTQQQSDVAQASAGLRAAEAGLQAARDGDSVIILKAWQDLQTAVGAVDADGQSVALQQEAVRAAGFRRQAGDITEGAVAQARLKLEQALSTQVRDQYAVLLRKLDLLFAMGLLAHPPSAPESAKPGSSPSGAVRGASGAGLLKGSQP